MILCWLCDFQTKTGGNTLFDVITVIDDAVFNTTDITYQLLNARDQLDVLITYYPASAPAIISARNQINGAVSNSPDIDGFPTGDLTRARNDYKSVHSLIHAKLTLLFSPYRRLPYPICQDIREPVPRSWPGLLLLALCVGDSRPAGAPEARMLRALVQVPNQPGVPDIFDRVAPHRVVLLCGHRGLGHLLHTRVPSVPEYGLQQLFVQSERRSFWWLLYHVLLRCVPSGKIPAYSCSRLLKSNGFCVTIGWECEST